MSKEIHMKAVWGAQTNKEPEDRFGFHVGFTCDGHEYRQFMNAKEYRKFCEHLDSEIVIAGWKLEFDRDKKTKPRSGNASLLGLSKLNKATEEAIAKYFRAVLSSYDQHNGE